VKLTGQNGGCSHQEQKPRFEHVLLSYADALIRSALSH
jgi:hypothetical protein